MAEIVKIVECTNHNEIYGYLKLENVTAKNVQIKIYEIKNDKTFLDKHPHWSIEDVFNEFPKDWKWTYVSDNGKCVEI